VTAEDWREMRARLDRRTEPVGTAIPFIERSTDRRLEARVGQAGGLRVVLAIGDETGGKVFMDPSPAMRLAWFLLEAAAGKAAANAARRAFYAEPDKRAR
jgi:hypothetical protein